MVTFFPFYVPLRAVVLVREAVVVVGREETGVYRSRQKIQWTWKILIPQPCPTLCKPMDRSSAHGVLQARILQWVSILLSRDLPNPRIKPLSPALLATVYHLSHQESPEDRGALLVYPPTSPRLVSYSSVWCSPLQQPHLMKILSQINTCQSPVSHCIKSSGMPVQRRRRQKIMNRLTWHTPPFLLTCFTFS